MRNENLESATVSHHPQKRICMIAYTNYPSDGRVRLEAETLVTWGYAVTFLVLKQHAVRRTYSLAGVTVHELDVAKYRGHNKISYVLSYLTFLVLASIACTRLFFRSHLKVIHVHNMPDLLVFAATIPRLLGCKVVLDLHDTVPETYAAKFGKISPIIREALCVEERVSCSMADRLICVNHVQREVVIQRGIPPGKVNTVITMPKFIPKGYSCRDGANGPVFRMVNHGTIAKRLGNDLLIEAAAKLRVEIPGFELHIVGGGGDIDELLELRRSLGLNNHVHFHKAVPWDELADKLSTMDVGIVANRVNVATQLMLPSKLIDYVVLGIPAIVPRLKALEYYFSDDMVSYFEPENVDSLVAATVQLYRDSGRRCRQAQNARSFLAKYNWENQEDGLKRLYADLVPVQ
jgi:glycosyltransferase involved in cell wall biosynthesis